MIQVNKREKKLLIVLAIVIGIALGYYLVIGPIISFKKNAGKSLDENIAKITKLDELYAEYKSIQNEKNQFNLETENTGVSSLVIDTATTLNIITNKVDLKDQQGITKNGVQLITTYAKFEGISIKNAIDLVYRIENSGVPLKISELNIIAGIKGKNRYDVIIKILSLTKR